MEKKFSEHKTNLIIHKKTVTKESLVKISLLNQYGILTRDKINRFTGCYGGVGFSRFNRGNKI